MILFKDDWQHFPTATVHKTTRNVSFIRIAQLYKHMGIENHLFPLALINPALEHIDPHDENLSDDIKGMIVLECKINPWYFFREVARAPVDGSRTGAPIRANRGNMALWWSFFNHIYIFLIQPRQTGKSMSTDALMEYLLLVQCTNTTINLMSKDNKLRCKNVERIREMMGLLPPWMYLKGPKDRENLEEITVTLLDNHYMTAVPRSSDKDAHNLGRGLTTPILQFDESPFQKHIETAMRAAIPAMGAATDSAKINGTPYGIIHTTTAGKRDDPDGKYIYSLIEKAAAWSEKFLDAKNHAELEGLVRSNSRGRLFRVNATFSHRQLGYSDEWLADKLENADQEGVVADRDYFNIWTAGNESLPFSLEIAEAIRRSQRDTVYQEITPEGYMLRWYIPENEVASRMKSSKFLIGMDPSDAGGSDDISFVMIDVETLDIVAAGTYNTINLNVFSNWLAKFMIKYENTIFCPENRSQGQSIIDVLLAIFSANGIDPFKRIFNWIVNNHQEYEDRFNEIKNVPMYRRNDNFYAHYKKQFGFATSGSGATSRTELYSTTLRRGLHHGASKIHDIVLIQQLLGLTTKNGRIDHADGGHDDMVIGWLMCMYVLIHGKNLSYYGIDTNRLMSKVVKEVELDPMDYIRKREQDILRGRLAELEELLLKEDDEFMSMKLEQELRITSKKVSWDDGEFNTIEQMLNNIRDKKKKAQSAKRLERMSQGHMGGNTGYNPYAIVQNGVGGRVMSSGYSMYR